MTDTALSRDVQQGWIDAQQDADAAHLGVRLYPYAECPSAAVPTAMFYAPNVLVNSPLISRAQRDDADQHIARHRILLYAGSSDNALVAKLRHELEHVVQWEEKGQPLFDLYASTGAALDTFIPQDRRGSGLLYNAVPLEADANAAAARFMRARLGEAVCDGLADSEEGVLFRAQPRPEAPTTAGVRTVCFAALDAQRVEEWLGPYPGGSRALIDALADDSALWDQLRADASFNERIASARAVAPDEHDVAASAPDFRRAWMPLRDALMSAYARAREIAGLASQ